VIRRETSRTEGETMSNASLAVHAGGVIRTREELAGLTAPLRTNTFTPIHHHDLVVTLDHCLAEQGIEIAQERWATNKRDALLFGALDLVIPGQDRDDYRFGLAIRTANDRSAALRMMAAARVFVCDNWAFSGSEDAVTMLRRHTGRLDLGREMPSAVERFLQKVSDFGATIEVMKGMDLTDAQVKEVIYDSFMLTNAALPVHLMKEVDALYFRDDQQRARFPDRTLWSLNNAYTEAIKRLSEKPASAARWGERTGVYFGRIVRQWKGR
jgi:hypothetical protein